MTTFLSGDFDYDEPSLPPMHILFPRSSLASRAVRFVLHLGAYRTKSLCIPMTTGWMHSKCKRMRDNAQVNVSRERDFGERMRLFSRRAQL